VRRLVPFIILFLLPDTLDASCFSPIFGFSAYIGKTFSIGSRDFGQCVVVQDQEMVLCTTASGEVFALGANDGSILWRRDLASPIRAKPFVHEGYVYVGTTDGCIFRLLISTGQATWEKPFCTSSAVYGDLVLAEELLFFSVLTNKVYAIDPISASFRWEYHRERPEPLSTEGVSSPMVADGRVFVGFSDGFLVALNQNSGAPEMEVKVCKEEKSRDVDTTPVLDGDTVYVACFGQGPSAMKKRDGSEIWKGQWFGASRPIVDGEQLVFSTADGEIVAARKKDGKAIFVTKLAGGAAYAPIVVSDFIIAPNALGIFLLSKKDGFPVDFSYVPGGVYQAPAEDDGNIFFVSGYGSILGLSVHCSKR
jgi:outer membrane protein assembly factor BamB